MDQEPIAEPLDPVDREYRRRWWRRCTVALFLLLLGAGAVYWLYLAEIPVDYESDLDHFKYGSIGSDYDGIPLRIWQVLPELFPEYLPEQGAAFLRIPQPERTYLDGYAQFGFLIEEGRPLPVGFSQRRVYVDRVGLNCALCHTSTVKVDPGLQPDRIDDHPVFIWRRNPHDHAKTLRSVLVPGMPANRLDLEAYFVFLFRCAEDQRFNADTILGAVEDAAQRSRQKLGAVESFILQRAVSQVRETLLERRRQLHYLALLPHGAQDTEVIPPFGPGRVDTFSPYKSIQFGFSFDGTYGIADYPSIWNQRPREGMQLHWDGNNTSVFERNISASLGAGATPVSLDLPRMLRVAKWIGSPPPGAPREPAAVRGDRQDPVPRSGELRIPQYPFSVSAALLPKGAVLFREYCYKCHDWLGAEIGQVVEISQIGTDRARLDSYTEALRANQNLLGAGHPWRFTHFRKTNGYANAPLDGIWARAPYLHNGSVPALRDLLNKPLEPHDPKGHRELTALGVTADDLPALARSPERVAKLIAAARKVGVRPPVFYRGDDEYDPAHGGFRCDRDHGDDGRKLFFYNTLAVKDGTLEPLLGNGNGGHAGKEYGTELTPLEKHELVEYLKTIGPRAP